MVKQISLSVTSPVIFHTPHGKLYKEKKLLLFQPTLYPSWVRQTETAQGTAIAK